MELIEPTWNEKCFTKGYKMFSPLLKQGKYCLFDAEKNKMYHIKKQIYTSLQLCLFYICIIRLRF